MPDIYGVDDTGQPIRTVSMYVADVNGVIKTVTDGWIIDTTGVAQRFWPSAPPAPIVTAKDGSPAWLATVVSWTGVTGATNYTLKANGVQVYSGTGLSYTMSVAPLSVTSYVVTVTNSAGLTTSTSALSYTAPGMPAPTSLHASTVAFDHIVWDWNDVSGATGYDLVNSASGSTVYSGAASTGTQTTAPSTKYSVKVRAKRGTALGGWSPAVSATTPAKPGPAAGQYRYAPTAYSTWQAGMSGGSAPGWRPQSDGMYANDGARWGSTRGVQTCFLFYNSAAIQAALRGGRVTRFQVEMYRVYGAGDYDPPKPVRWWMHTYGGATGSTPGWNTAVAGGQWYGTLDDSEYKWIDLPASWGQQYVDGFWKGIAAGNDTNLDNYMKFVRDSSHATGDILFTIG